MKIEIIKIESKGDFDKECVTIKVIKGCDAGAHILADSTYTEKKNISNKLRHTYWLPDKTVAAGDFIKIYTKPGENSSVTNKAKTITHTFYWGLKTAVWNDDGDCAVLLEISGWAHTSCK